MQTLSHISYPLPSDSVKVKVMNLSVLNHMSTRVKLIYLIFKGIVFKVKISFVQAENTMTLPVHIAVIKTYCMLPLAIH